MLGHIGSMDMEETLGGIVGAAGGIRFAYTEEEIKAAVAGKITAVQAYISAQTTLALEAAKRGGAKDGVTFAQIVELAERYRHGPCGETPRNLKRDVQLAFVHVRRVTLATNLVGMLSLVLERGRFVQRSADGRVALQFFEISVLVEPWTPKRLERTVPDPLVEEGMGYGTAMAFTPRGYGGAPVELDFEQASASGS